MQAELAELFDLERLEVNLFRGPSRDIGSRRVFGGQVLGQALLAAQRTVTGREAHSLHAYFLRMGDPEAPIVYEVDRSRDGGSFSARRVVAIQHGQPIFTMGCSFQRQEDGLEHQTAAPEVPPPDRTPPNPITDPEDIRRLPQMLQRWLREEGPFVFRPVQPVNPLEPESAPALQQVWFRLNGRVPEDPALARALLAYASDFHLIGTAMRPHGISFLDPQLQIASLDHAMWFYRQPQLDDWFLYACDSPVTRGARGLARGMVYDRSGTLVAATCQEGLIRLRDAERA